MKISKIITPMFLIFILILSGCSKKTEHKDIVKLAAEIHERVLTIDTHADTPLDILDDGFDIGVKHDPNKRGGKIDLPRMKEGGLDAIFFAVYVGQGSRTEKGNKNAKKKADIFGAVHESVKKNSGLAELAYTSEDAYRIEKSGKRAIFTGIENGYPVGKDISLVKEFYDLGARYITLCHSSNNDICDSSTDRKGPEHDGLSEFGKKVVKEMNRLGIMIDVSHASDKTFYDVVELSEDPVIASHSCSRNLCDHKRNMNDDMLKKLAEKNGVIQICFVSSFVKTLPANPARDSAYTVLREKYSNKDELTEKEKKERRNDWNNLNEKYPRELATVSDFVNHIDHVVKVAGIDHVGIGTDFDGGGSLKGCYDVSELGNITLELVKRAYTEEQIQKIWGGNLIRVFREVEKIKIN